MALMVQNVDTNPKYSAGILIIGSAGDIKTVHEKKTKLKDVSKENNELSVEYDAQLLKKFVENDSWCSKNVKIYGSVTMNGKVGKNLFIQETIKDFLASKDFKHYLIYYTGHGNKCGDWCFNDGTISYDFVSNTFGLQRDKEKKQLLYIISDTCYSGKWVDANSKSKHWQYVSIQAACKPDCKTFDNFLSNYLFTENFKSLSDKSRTYHNTLFGNEAQSGAECRQCFLMQAANHS